MTGAQRQSNIGKDDHVDGELATYLNPDAPRSFFLFAGAGSGKTRSLVNALNHIKIHHGKTLAYRGQRVGVITYTNAACDEITRRLDFDPLFHVSTIHSFAWDLIQNFHHDIREWLRTCLETDIATLKEAETKGRAGTKASITRQAQIESKTRRIQRLDSIRSFSYSPTGENGEPNSLNHAEVIAISSDFLSSKPLMQWILVGRFPVLLVDESQDTNKRLVNAFFATANTHEGRFALGLIGDTMQRIYADGKERIEHGLPESWAKPSKKLNHRCPKRVVRLINQIRSVVDQQAQEPRSDAIEGTARLFIRPVAVADRQAVEDAVRAKMAQITADELWQSRNSCKILTLEHHMAAKRLGFEQILEPLLEIDKWRTGLMDGSLPATRFFAEDVLPLVEAAQRDDKFAVARIVREKSPLVSKQALEAAQDAGSQLRKAQAAVDVLIELWRQGEPTFGDVLDAIALKGLLSVPDALKPIARLRLRERNQSVAMPDEIKALFEGIDLDLSQIATDEPADAGAEKADPLPEHMDALLKFLEAPFSQVESYRSYVSGQASFDTHQGVKGLEFDRVMVIMDDQEARGFMFGYDKLFGAKEPSPTDLQNEASGKETGVDRTRRLLYVTCSRAEKSLALVAYTDNPQAVRQHVLANGWFSEDEIDILA